MNSVPQRKPNRIVRPGSGVPITEFGRRLKKARTEKHMTVRTLATLIGQADSQITGYENRGVYPRFSQLMALCAALDVGMEWLCEGELGDAYEQVDGVRAQ